MVTFEKTIHINCPQQEVFDFVSDPANDALYRSGAKFAEWSSKGPAGVGSTMRTVDRFMGREVETMSEIHDLESAEEVSTLSRVWTEALICYGCKVGFLWLVDNLTSERKMPAKFLKKGGFR